MSKVIESNMATYCQYDDNSRLLALLEKYDHLPVLPEGDAPEGNIIYPVRKGNWEMVKSLLQYYIAQNMSVDPESDEYLHAMEILRQVKENIVEEKITLPSEIDKIFSQYAPVSDSSSDAGFDDMDLPDHTDDSSGSGVDLSGVSDATGD